MDLETNVNRFRDEGVIDALTNLAILMSIAYPIWPAAPVTATFREYDAARRKALDNMVCLKVVLIRTTKRRMTNVREQPSR